jgi:molybdopterin molybdotransferase
MIKVEEARKLIRENVSPAMPVKTDILAAGNHVLAKDVFASADFPPFNQSSMDGFAFAYQDWNKTNALPIEGEVAAGRIGEVHLRTKSAIRIFTGAAVPAEADTVVMKEKVKEENGRLLIIDDKLERGNNVRPVGAEIKKGELALPAGTLLGPAAIGFLTGIGITEVEIYRDPVVTILITGNELKQPGEVLELGQVFDSNSFSLRTVLRQLDIHDVSIVKVIDDPKLLDEALAAALDRSDMVLLTGGVSVGDYDFVVQSTEHCGVTQVFHKINQRPGKPLYFGMKQKKVVFGLPGNPSSVLTCFYEYVIPAIENLTGKRNIVKSFRAPLKNDYIKNASLSFFLKGHYDGNEAAPLEAQESYRMSSFAKSNCLIYFDEEAKTYKKGELVEVHLLPL